MGRRAILDFGGLVQAGRVWGAAFVAVALGLFMCAPRAAAQPWEVFVSIAPQKQFVERIGAGLVSVVVMVPPGASPHVYEPTPAQMRALSEARLYFAIGVEFEKALLPKITALHPDLQIVHTDSGIRKMPMVPHHHAHDHNHGQHGCAHDHPLPERERKHADTHDHQHGEGLDNHVWLSPDLVRIQAGHIQDALAALDPAHATVYKANYKAFAEELDALDAELRAALTGMEGSAFMVFHPAWGYFARQYGLEQVPVEVEGKEPKAQDLQRLIDRARSERIRVVFVSPQFSTRAAETIAQAIDGRTVAVNPLAEDWMENMRRVAEQFRQAMQKQGVEEGMVPGRSAAREDLARVHR